MSDNVEVTIEGAVGEKENKKSAVMTGTGTVSIEIPDINKSSISVDYQEEDKLKISLKSESTLKLNAESSIKLSGAFDYDLLNKSIDGKAGIDFEISKSVAMTLQQSFSQSGETTSAKLSFKF